jgi:hypothetical protein
MLFWESGWTVCSRVDEFRETPFKHSIPIIDLFPTDTKSQNIFLLYLLRCCACLREHEGQSG